MMYTKSDALKRFAMYGMKMMEQCSSMVLEDPTCNMYHPTAPSSTLQSTAQSVILSGASNNLRTDDFPPGR